MARTVNETKTEITPFTIPFAGTPFDIKPKWTFDLPGGRKMLVFEHEVRRDTGGPRAVVATFEMVPAFAVLVQRKGGAYEDCVGGRSRTYCGASILTEPLDVMILAQDLATKYAPKKTTSRREEDFDE